MTIRRLLRMIERKMKKEGITTDILDLTICIRGENGNVIHIDEAHIAFIPKDEYSPYSHVTLNNWEDVDIFRHIRGEKWREKIKNE